MSIVKNGMELIFPKDIKSFIIEEIENRFSSGVSDKVFKLYASVKRKKFFIFGKEIRVDKVIKCVLMSKFATPQEMMLFSYSEAVDVIEMWKKRQDKKELVVEHRQIVNHEKSTW